MSRLVIDASALLDLASRPAIAEFVHASHEVCAPSLVVWEVGHVVHRAPKVFGDRKARRRLVASLVRPLRLIEQSDRTDALADLIDTYKLSFYDAAYLQAALDEHGILLTEDRTLLAAAKAVIGDERVWTVREASVRAARDE